MPKAGATRESHFPAIEKRYGEPMSHWHKVMARVAGKTYPEQMAHLQENHGFSKTHANALVMYTRGSLSARRHATPTSSALRACWAPKQPSLAVQNSSQPFARMTVIPST